jgi:parallel beta-helix repeat protein
VVRANRIRDGKGAGILITDRARPRLEENEISGSAEFGIAISGAGTDPTLSGNRIYDGKSAGVVIAESASPQIERNALDGDVGISDNTCRD